MGTSLENPLNSFAVISFNVQDPNATYRCEYLDIGNTGQIFRKSTLNASNKVLENRKPFEYDYTDLNYWVLNTGDEFVVSSMPVGIDQNKFPNLFCGPFLSEFLAKNFIREMNDYLNDDGI